MSIAQNPVMGKMAKSFANVNTYVHKGQNVISAKSFNRKDPNTEAQQVQRTSFKLISDAWAALGGFGERGFPSRSERLSAFNVFMSLNLPNAIDSSGEVPAVDYSLLQIAKGSLPEVVVEQATITAAGISLQCESNVGFPKASADDVVNVLVKKAGRPLKAVQTTRGEAEQLQIDVALPGINKEEVEFIYAFVNSADGKKASNSVFVQIG